MCFLNENDLLQSAGGSGHRGRKDSEESVLVMVFDVVVGNLIWQGP